MNAIDAIRASLNSYPEDRLDRETARALLDRLVRAEARIRAVRDVLDWAESRTPGIKAEHRAVHIADIRRALESVPPPRSE